MRTLMKQNRNHSNTNLWALILLLSTFGSALMAQNISIGPKVGISSATGAGSDVPDETEAITGFIGGMFFRYNTGGVIAIQPELLYQRKGGFYNGNNLDYKLTIDYLEVPLLFKLQIPVGEAVYPFIYAGPYAAFELQNQTDGDVFSVIDYQGTADINDFDAGAVLGAGMDVQLSSFYIGFDARYGIGMVNIYAEDNDGSQPDIKNRSLSFMLGLGVNLDE